MAESAGEHQADGPRNEASRPSPAAGAAGTAGAGTPPVRAPARKESPIQPNEVAAAVGLAGASVREIPKPAKEPDATPEVVREAVGGAVGNLQPLTGLQRAALWVIAGAGVALCIELALATGYWIFGGPPTPSLPPAPTQASASPTPGAFATAVADYKSLSTTMLDNYKVLNDANTSRSKDLIDSTGVKVIVPILTLVLGYLFGVRSSSG